MLFLMLPQSLASPFQRCLPILRESPGALELLAPDFLHMSKRRAIGQIRRCVLLDQLRLYGAHFVILTIAKSPN
jgi:hypothetical protein